MDHKKLVIYTALFGNYDQLEDPKEHYEACDFVCFTDQHDLKSKIWKIVYIKPEYDSSLLMNRKIKMMPHRFLKEWDHSLYVDSNIKIKSSPFFMLEKYLQGQGFNFFVARHYLRNCIYKEAAQCIKLGKGNPSEIKSQLEAYKKSGFPEAWGLSENNIILRTHTDDKVIKLCEEWWEQFLSYSKRDQLSLPFSLWKNGLEYEFLEESCRDYFGVFSIELHTAENKKLNGIRKTWFKYVYSKRNPLSRFLLNR